MEYPDHPAAALFPMMSEAQLRDLAEDIKANGLRSKILLHEGMILDGRNRLRACELAGVQPDFAPANLNGGSPALFVVTVNLPQRDLTSSQKAAVGAEITEMLKDEQNKLKPEVRKRGRRPKSAAPPSGDPALGRLLGESRHRAAAALGIGKTPIQQAVSIKMRDAAMFDRIKRGEITVNLAYRQIMGEGFARRKNQSRESLLHRSDKIKNPHDRHRRAEVRRMIESLSMARIGARLCTELRVAWVAPCLSASDAKAWVGDAEEASRDLREFAQALRSALAALKRPSSETTERIA